MKIPILLVLFLFLLPLPCVAGEVEISKAWCAKHGGKAEYRLFDGSRVDCLLPRYAVEAEYAKKWAESIGQSLYYAEMTKRKPAILLLVKKGDDRYVSRLVKIAKKYRITVWKHPL